MAMDTTSLFLALAALGNDGGGGGGGTCLVVFGYYYEGNFYEDSAHTLIIEGNEGKLYIDKSAGNLYRYQGTEYIKLGGTNNGYVFADYSTMVSQMNDEPANKYGLGSNFYIVTVNVPDLWLAEIAQTSVPYTYVSDEQFVADLIEDGYIQMGYYKFCALETQKVDLTNYYTKTQIDSITPLVFHVSSDGTTFDIQDNTIISAANAGRALVMVQDNGSNYRSEYQMTKYNPGDSIIFSYVQYVVINNKNKRQGKSYVYAINNGDIELYTTTVEDSFISSDIQINNSTIIDPLTGIANIPLANVSDPGVVQSFSTRAFNISSGSPYAGTIEYASWASTPTNAFVGKQTLDNIVAGSLVRFDTATTLTTNQKEQARTNIGAGIPIVIEFLDPDE